MLGARVKTLSSQLGESSVTYGLIVGLVGVTIIAVTTDVGNSVNRMFNGVSSTLDQVGGPRLEFTITSAPAGGEALEVTTAELPDGTLVSMSVTGPGGGGGVPATATATATASGPVIVSIPYATLEAAFGAGAELTVVLSAVLDGETIGDSQFTVTISNDAPVAVDDSFTITEDDDLINADVLSNDSDPDNGTLSVVSAQVEGSTPGGPTVNGDGTVDYATGSHFDYLNAGESATALLSYIIDDGQGGTASAGVTITITGVNDPPDAVDDSGAAFTVNEGAAFQFTATDLTSNDTDAEMTVLTVTSVTPTGSNGGTITSLGGGAYSFDPGTSFDDLTDGQSRGTSFSYTIQDEGGASDTATLTVTVNGVPDPCGGLPRLATMPRTGGGSWHLCIGETVVASNITIANSLMTTRCIAPGEVDAATFQRASNRGGGTMGAFRYQASAPSHANVRTIQLEGRRPETCNNAACTSADVGTNQFRALSNQWVMWEADLCTVSLDGQSANIGSSLSHQAVFVADSDQTTPPIPPVVEWALLNMAGTQSALNTDFVGYRSYPALREANSLTLTEGVTATNRGGFVFLQEVLP